MSETVSQELSQTTSSALEPKFPPLWQVSIGHWGQSLLLNYAEEPAARATYADLCAAMAAKLDFRNDAPSTVEASDDFGQHTFDAREIKSVRLIDIAHMARVNHHNAKAAEAASSAEQVPVTDPGMPQNQGAA